MSDILPASLYRGRFAPSPTGPLHMGSVLAALGSWLMARKAGGQWLVRIEDVDRPRSVPGAATRQLEALARLGLDPDAPPLWQSEREDDYAQALERLLASDQAFPCWCSRSDLAAQGGVHRSCAKRRSRAQPSFRLRVADARVAFVDGVRGPCSQDLGAEVGDFVLRRADGCWAYQLAVVVDDALQGITEIVRGADLLDSTPRQICLQRALDYETPAYAHLPLVRQADGHKLGKSSGSAAFDPARPLAAIALAYRWLGQDRRALDGAEDARTALVLALAAFRRDQIPAADRVLE